jgi:hypothetical protein
MIPHTLTLLALHPGAVPHVHPHAAPLAIALVLVLLVATIAVVLGSRRSAG